MENDCYLDRYINALKQEDKKQGTLKQYTSDLKHFISWLDESAKKDLLHIESSHVTAYLDYLTEKKFSNATMQRHLSALNQFLAFYEIRAAYSAKPAETYHVTAYVQVILYRTKNCTDYWNP